jgi:hypothetical protein
MFLYYFNNAKVFSPSLLSPAGLDHLQGLRFVSREDAGPAGGRGIIVAFRRDDRPDIPSEQVMYWPDKQTWIDCGTFWLGYDALPKPEHLERARMLRGNDVTLGDGGKWIIPCTEWLPTRGEYRAGHWTRARQAKYDAQYADAQTVFQWVTAEKSELAFDVLYDILTRTIALNYHIGPHELSALGAMAEDNIHSAAVSMLDMEQWREIQKAWADSKKEEGPADTPATSDSAPGETG